MPVRLLRSWEALCTHLVTSGCFFGGLGGVGVFFAVVGFFVCVKVPCLPHFTVVSRSI